MMAIARIYISPKFLEEKGIQCDTYIWDYVVKNYPSWKDNNVEVLYLTQRCDERDTSLIVDIKDSNAFGDFVIKHIAPLEHIDGIWLFNLIRPRFFLIPEGTPHNYQRHTVTIDADPQEYANIYETISKIQPTEDVIITYIAYTFQAERQDILISVIGRDSDAIEKFVSRHIKTLKGIRGLETTFITRTKRLVSSDEWREYIKSHMGFFPKSKEVKKGLSKDIEPWDYSISTICC